MTGRRLTFDEGVALLRAADLLALGRAADAVCQRLHPEPYRTYNIDRNINYTNVCAAVCDFCAFYRKTERRRRLRPRRARCCYKKIEETIALGGDQILMQGGTAPVAEARVVRGAAPRPQGALPAGQPARLQPAGDLALPQAQQAAAARRCCSGSRTPAWAACPAAAARSSSIASARRSPRQGADRRLARRPPRLARARRPVDLHDDVRPRRDAGRADRAPRAAAPAAGRDRRLHRVHLLDVPARAHRHGRRPAGRGVRVPARRRPSPGSTSTTSPTSSRRG